MKKIFTVATSLALAACGSTPPTMIGENTYYASGTNAGMFGDPNVVAGHLMTEANEFCASKHQQQELVSQVISPSGVGRLGGASITFKCLDHAGPVQMRPDAGVVTLTQ